MHDDFGTIIELDELDYPDVGVVIKGYINELNFDKATFEEFTHEVMALKEHVNLGEYFKISTTTIKDSDWENSWKDYFDILHVGEKFVIVPTWKEYENTDNKYIINIDPGMAFGTGGHETTSLCIRNLEKYVKPHDNIIDVGTGSGILTIAASHLTDGKLKALDLDKLAVDVAKENLALNGLAERVEVEEARLI